MGWARYGFGCEVIVQRGYYWDNFSNQKKKKEKEKERKGPLYSCLAPIVKKKLNRFVIIDFTNSILHKFLLPKHLNK